MPHHPSHYPSHHPTHNPTHHPTPSGTPSVTPSVTPSDTLSVTPPVTLSATSVTPQSPHPSHLTPCGACRQSVGRHRTPSAGRAGGTAAGRRGRLEKSLPQLLRAAPTGEDGFSELLQQVRTASPKGTVPWSRNDFTTTLCWLLIETASSVSSEVM